MKPVTGQSALLSCEQLGLNLNGVSLLRGIDLQMPSGSVTAILGPNGAGKTSLLRCLSGEQIPSEGHVILAGRELAQWSSLDRATMMAVLPQQSPLSFPFTAREVVMLGRTPHSVGRQRDAHVVKEALALVDGDYLADRLYPQLSGGEKQRIQLARVLAQIWLPPSAPEPVPSSAEALKPRVLLLDEPTAAFDLAHQQMTLDIARHMADEGVAVVMVLHDLNLAARCADQLVLLQCGEVMAQGVASDVLRVETIKQVFAVDVEVSTHPVSGRPLVIPL